MNSSRKLKWAVLRRLVLSLFAAALISLPAQAQNGMTFRISSLGNDVIQDQAAFEGTYTVQDGRLDVNVTYGVMRMLDRPNFEARTTTVTELRFGIAHHVETPNGRGTFVIDALGPARPLGVVLTVGKDAPLTPYQTSVAIPPGTPLTDRWLIAELRFPVTPEGSTLPCAIVAHTGWGEYLAGTAAPAPQPRPAPAPPQPAPAPPREDVPAAPAPRAPESPSDPADGVPFHFSSIGGMFSTQGDFSGHYHMGGRQIIFDVERAILAKPTGVRVYPSHFTSGIQFCLSHIIDPQKGAWSPETRSVEIPLELRLQAGGQVELDPFQIAVPIAPGMDLKGHWVTIQITESVIYRGQKNNTRCYVHSSSKIFDK